MKAKENNYYSFGRIVSGLRPLYQNMQESLGQLSEHIIVRDKSKCEARAVFQMKEHDFEPFNTPKLLLEVKRNPNSPVTAISDAISRNGKDPYRWARNNASYKIKEHKSKLQLRRDRSQIILDAFDPQVEIDQSKELDAVTSDIKSNELFNLTRLSVDLSPFQSLSISGKGIALVNCNTRNRMLTIAYNAENDTVTFDGTYRFSRSFAEELLDNTKIPKYELGEEYCSILDSIDRPMDVILEAKVRRKKDELEIKEEEGKRLYLVRKGQ